MCALCPQAYAQHKKAPSRSLRIYVQELPVTMNLVWPVVLRDGYFWYGECAAVCELQLLSTDRWQQGLASGSEVSS
jgi:hypothetical protein